MGGKETRSLNGITLEGVPLGTAIERIEDVEKSSEAREVLQETIQGHQRNAPRYTGNTSVEETKRVSKRTVHLPAEQIRKEYGIMKKPYNTLTENVLWVIFEKGPISAKNIAVELDFAGTQSTLSAALSAIWKRLGAEVVSREAQEGHHKSYIYYRHPHHPSVSVEVAYQQFKDSGRAEQRAKKAMTPPATPPAKEKKAETPTTFETIEKTLEMIKGLKDSLGVKVEVSGGIDITFKWE